MKRIIGIIVLFATVYGDPTAPQVLCNDSNGLAVLVKEQYGPEVTDTGSVVMINEGAIWITHKYRSVSYYPTSRYSIEGIKRLKEVYK